MRPTIVKTLIELVMECGHRHGSAWGWIDLNRMATHAKTNSTSPYAPIPVFGEHPRKIPSNVKGHTGTEHVDCDNHHQAYGDPNRGANHFVPITDQDCGGTAE